MGLLDSNKVFQGQKSGSFTLNLTTDSSQNVLSFANISYGTFKFVVSGIDADVLVNVKGCVNNSTSEKLSIKDKDGNVVGLAFSTNGTYYVDIVGYSSLFFALSRTASSGTATVNWSLVQNSNDQSIPNNIRQICETIKPDNLGSSETFSLASVADLKTYNLASTNFRCLVLNVSAISDGAMLSRRINNYTSFPVYDTNGNIILSISAKGIYYIPLNYPANLILRNEKAIEGGSVTVTPYFLKEFPKELLEFKPLQVIASKKIDFSSSSEITVFQNTETKIIKYFRYFYVAYQIKNGTSSVDKNVVISVQPFNGITGHKKTVLEGDTYSNETDWLEVKSFDGIAVYAKDSNYVSGDNIEVKLIGIR